MKKILFIILFSMIPVSAFADTYYMANNPCSGNSGWGNGSNSNAGTKAAPYLTIQYAMTQMSGGDTLIIDDGTYTGTTNGIVYGHQPPNGSAGAYTTIQAENVGKVILDGSGTNQMMIIRGDNVSDYDRSYIHIDGIIVTHATQGSDSGIFEVAVADYIKITRCAAYDAYASGSYQTGEGMGNGFYASYTDHVLFEDCWAWGNLCYNFCTYGPSSNLIFRRCIARHDVYLLYSSQSSFAVYNAGMNQAAGGTVLFQNCIDIDSDTTNYATGEDSSLWPTYTWMVRDVAGTGSIVSLVGCISLNHSGISLLTSNQETYSSMTFTNCIVNWDNIEGGYLNGTIPITINHSVIGPIGGTQVYSPGTQNGVYNNGGASYTVNNSILYGVTASSTYAVGSGATSDYNSYYNNTNNFNSVSEGAHDLCSQNSNAIDPLNGSLEYLMRIENGSDFDGAAPDNGDIGATILYQVGVSGTLYGETGYDTLQDGSNNTTATPLWPFPNEDLIKEKMAAYSYDSGNLSGARGFAASGKQFNGTDDITLTSYIWEYLGNEMPADIYGAYITVTGTVTDATESDMVAGDKTLILTVYGDTWAAFDNTIRAAIVAGLNSTSQNATDFSSLFEADPGSWSATGVVRTSDTVCTITFPASATYDIATSDTITAVVPATALTGGEEITASPTFSIGYEAIIAESISAAYVSTGPSATYTATGISIAKP